MSGFSADWLHLREPFDHQARHTAFSALGLLQQVESWRATHSDKVLSLVDLACGSGSNFRALAPQLGGNQRWRLVDHDPALLAAVPHVLASWARQNGYDHQVRPTEVGTQNHMQGQNSASPERIEITGPRFSAEITWERLDLAQDLSRLDFTQVQWVTGSALLDLVSAQWLNTLVQQAHKARAAMFFTLNVDGRTTWTPADAQDPLIHRLFEAHQSLDKGFGLALGAHAVPLALQMMKDAGYVGRHTQSDWVIDTNQATQHPPVGDAKAMLAAMLDGITTAALEQAQTLPQPDQTEVIQATSEWRARRHALIASTCLQVGHVDICATWPSVA